MGWSQTFIDNLPSNEILKPRLAYPVFHAEAYAGPSGAAKCRISAIVYHLISTILYHSISIKVYHPIS